MVPPTSLTVPLVAKYLLFIMISGIILLKMMSHQEKCVKFIDLTFNLKSKSVFFKWSFPSSSQSWRWICTLTQVNIFKQFKQQCLFLDHLRITSFENQSKIKKKSKRSDSSVVDPIYFYQNFGSTLFADNAAWTLSSDI